MTYCRALLSDQAAASTAVHGTFLAARVHAGRLADPHLLRAWLYALARVECRRLRRSREREERRPGRGRIADPRTGRARPPEPAPKADDAFLDEEDHRRLEMRKLVHGALSGLHSREREAVDLLVRHGMTPVELAGVLGLDDATAAELAVAARTALEDALRVPAVAEFGRCPQVTAMVTGKQRPLDPEVVRDVDGHMAEGCRICAQDRDRLAAATLLRTLPVAPVPAELRAQVMLAATDPAQEQARLAAARNVEPLDEWGWPLPATSALPPGGRRRAATADAPAVAGARGERRGRGRAGRGVLAAARWAGSAGGRDPARPVGDRGLQCPLRCLLAAHAGDHLADLGAEQPLDEPDRALGVPVDRLAHPHDRPHRHAAVAASAASAAPTAAAAPSPQRTLWASGCQMPRGQRSCAIRITAQGGVVEWRVTGAQGPISVAGGGGRLAPGQTETLTVSRVGRCDEGESGTVFFSPGGAASVSWRCHWWE